jgi:hypothetical protein
MTISKKDRRALIICGVFLAIVVIFMGGIDPYLQRYDTAMEKIKKQEKALAGLRRKKKLLRPRQRKLRTTRIEIREMLNVFGGIASPEDRLSVCIRSFQDAATESGAVLHSIRPLPVLEQNSTSFDEYRFEISFSGSYETVQDMLYRLETGTCLHRTRQMTLVLEKGVVNCRMVAERFFYHGDLDPATHQPVVNETGTTQQSGERNG